MGFAIIPEEILSRQEDFSPHSIAVLLALVGHMNSEGVFYPSVKRLALKANVSHRGAKVALRDWVALGYLVRSKNAALTPGDVYAWGPKINMQSNSIFQKMGVQSNSTDAVKQHESVQSNSINAVKTQQEELEEKKKSTFSSKKLNTCSQTAQNMRLNSTPENMQSNSKSDDYEEHIRKTMDVFSHVQEERIVEFFAKQSRIVEKHEPITRERLEYCTDEAIISVMEWPNEETEYTGRGIWGFFCKCWARIRFGDTRFNIWNFSTLDAESYWNRKNYKKPTEAEMKVRRAEGQALQAEQDRINLFRELGEYLADKDKYLEQESGIAENKSFLDNINANHPDDEKKEVHPAMIEALVRQKERVGEKLGLLFRRYKFTEESFNQKCDEFLVYEEKRLKEQKEIRCRLSKETWYVGVDK